MPGPPRTPTGMLKLRGSWLAAARDADGEMTPRRGRPDPPDELDEHALKVWEYFMPELDYAGVMTLTDRDTFAMYCQLTAEWWKLDRFIKEKSYVYPIRNKAGDITEIKEFPQVKLRHKIGEQLIRLAREFGLTPAARSRIQPILSGDKSNDDEHSKFFSAG